MISYKFIIASLGLMVLTGCGQQIPAGEESKYLFSLKSGETLGDNNGVVALHDAGIFIHPGDTTPTTATFNLDDKHRSIKLRPFIAKLDAGGEKNPDAGIVGVELLLDGKSVDKFLVDRNSNLEKTLEVKGVKSLAIRVDNGNGPGWDWFTVKVLSIQ